MIMGLFDDEAGGGRLNPADCIEHRCARPGELTCDCVGHLLLVWAVDYIEHSPTKYSKPDKQSDVVVVDVVDLDQPDEDGYQGLIVRNAWWRNARLIGFMKPRIGRPRPVIAWMGMGIATMGKPPYELRMADKDPFSVERATAWFAAHPDFRPTARQGRNPDAERVQSQPPVQRELSQLEKLAASRVAGTNEHQQSLRDAASRPVSQLPPARPVATQEPEPPF
jgi:hypothetical protein